MCPYATAPECLVVHILDDTTLESAQESFQVVLRASSGSEGVVDIETAVVEVNIEDDDRGELAFGGCVSGVLWFG